MIRAAHRGAGPSGARPVSRCHNAIETLEPRRLFAAVAWDGGGDNSNWADPNNWSTNQMPGPADDVTINPPSNTTVTIHSGTAANVHSLDLNEFLVIDGGGSLNLAAASHVRDSMFVHGSLTGAGRLDVDRFIELYSGSSMTGAGTVSVGAAGQFFVGGPTTIGRNVACSGTFKWDSGDITLNGGSIASFGTWEVGSNLTPRDLVMRRTGASVGFADVSNMGTMRMISGSATFTGGAQSVKFYNDGDVQLASGDLYALGGGSNVGAVHVDGAQRKFTAGGDWLFDAASSVAGTGRLQLDGPGNMELRGTVGVATLGSTATDAGFTQGTINVNRIEVTGGGDTWFAHNVSFPSGLVSGGRLTTASDMTFTSTLDWTGGILDGSGRFVIPSAAQMNISGNAGRLLNGRIDVNGSADWSGGAIDIAGTITNNGTFRIEPSSATALMMDDASVGHVSHFVNNGTLRKLNAAMATLDVTVNQNASVIVEQGTLKSAAGANYGGSATNRANVGATLAFDGVHTFSATNAFNSFAGTLRIDGGNTTYAGSIPGAENITFAGGTFTLGGTPAHTLSFTGGVGVLNGSGTITGGSMSAGEWRGSGNVTINSNFVWTAGTIGGTGTLTTAAPDSVLEISGADIHHVARPLVLRGYTNWLGGDIDVTETGSIRNDGNFGAMNTTGTVRLFRSGGGAPFVNNGTFAKFFGGEARIDGTFNNAGLVTVPAGSVALAQGGIHSGDFNVAAGAELELGGGHSLSTNSSLTGAGSLALRGALVNVASDQAFDGSVIVDGSSAVTFAGARTELGALTIANFGTASLAAGGGRLLVTASLHVDAVGRLDLADNDMILDYAGASPLAAMQAWINQGRNGGAWNGNGITSTAAQVNPQHNTTLGAMASADWHAVYGAAAPFDGVNPDDTAVLIKYTYYGDADFNGKVNFDDYVRTDSGFNNHKSGWFSGDFDGNGQVNFDDYVLIDLAFNTQSATL